jgi:hypothetical protein
VWTARTLPALRRLRHRRRQERSHPHPLRPPLVPRVRAAPR